MGLLISAFEICANRDSSNSLYQQSYSKRPGAIELLYSALPLQCKQCGFRYPETSDGQIKMDAHLDWHFRQNRRMKERAKRGLSRSWFVTEEEWISGTGGEVTQQQGEWMNRNPCD